MSQKPGAVRQITSKRYRCKECGHEVTQSTNHYGETYSFGSYNTCPNCPPYKKYSWFGGTTVWVCMESPPGDT